jgi:hypothetical protein
VEIKVENEIKEDEAPGFSKNSSHHRGSLGGGHWSQGDHEDVILKVVGKSFQNPI